MKPFTESSVVFIVFRSLIDLATENSDNLTFNHFLLEEISRNKISFGSRWVLGC